MLKYFRKIKGQGGHTNEYYDYLFVRFKIKSFDDLIEVLRQLDIRIDKLNEDSFIWQDKNHTVWKLEESSKKSQFVFVYLCNTFVKIVLNNSSISLAISGKEGFDDGWGKLVEKDYENASEIEKLLEKIDISNRINNE